MKFININKDILNMNRIDNILRNEVSSWVRTGIGQSGKEEFEILDNINNTIGYGINVVRDDFYSFALYRISSSESRKRH